MRETNETGVLIFALEAISTKIGGHKKGFQPVKPHLYTSMQHLTSWVICRKFNPPLFPNYDSCTRIHTFLAPNVMNGVAGGV